MPIPPGLDIEHLTLALGVAPTPMLVVNADGVIVFSNRPLATLFDYLPGDLVGQSVEILVSPAARTAHPALRRAFFEQPQTRAMGSGRELFGKARGGRQIPVEIGLNPIQLADGAYVIATVLDITERQKRAAMFRLAVDAAPNGMIMINSAGAIVLANREASRLFGYAQEALVGRPIETLIPERYRRQHAMFRAMYAAAATRRAMGERRDLFGRRADGSEFPLQIGLQPITAIDGEQLIMSSVIDVTERKRSEAEIRAKSAQLLRLNDELLQFAYSTSHDLKAPLVTIEGLAAAIAEDIGSGDLAEAASSTHRVRRLCQGLSTLIEDVLALAKSSHVDSTFTQVDIAALVGDIRVRFEQLFSAQDVELELELAAPIISTQPIRMRQILENLISNALKFAHADRERRYVRVETRVIDVDFVELVVADNGVGIPEEHHDNVFRMFRRFHSHDMGGSGLGLPLVRSHVRALGGEIRFESSPAGTSMIVTLPRAPDEGDQA